MKEELICYCKQITKNEVIKAIENGAINLREVQETTNACTGNQCEELNPKGVCCEEDINELLPTKPRSCSCCC